MHDTVRNTKRACDLQPGDWIAAGLDNNEIDGTDDAEVLFVYRYATGGGATAAVTIQEATIPRPELIILHADTEVTLLTAEEVAELKADGERAQKIADIRALADWLEAHPEMPMSYAVHGQTHGLTGQDVPRLRELAKKAGRPVVDRLDDRTDFDVYFGSGAQYTCIAWHPEGRPAEPKPDTDPTGLRYTRADDGDEPTAGLALTDRAHEVLAVAPVSPARVPMHIGVVDDEDGA
jgi:hypothetical protein